jgi:pyridoxine 5-phosphate synthase
VRAIAGRLRQRAPAVEFNIEGDPRPELLDLVAEVRPSQCTLVPVSPGEVTSQAGWQPDSRAQSIDALPDVVRDLKARGIRVSLFVDAEKAAVDWAASISADRVELYTEPFARAFTKGPAIARESFARFEAAARLADSLGLAVNAGHDLDLDNLVLFRNLPSLAEVSIGHAIVSRALFVGLSTVVREYLDVLQQRLLS